MLCTNHTIRPTIPSAAADTQVVDVQQSLVSSNKLQCVPAITKQPRGSTALNYLSLHALKLQAAAPAQLVRHKEQYDNKSVSQRLKRELLNCAIRRLCRTYLRV